MASRMGATAKHSKANLNSNLPNTSGRFVATKENAAPETGLTASTNKHRTKSTGPIAVI